MAIIVANLIEQIENSYSRAFVAQNQYYDGGFLVRETPNSLTKRLNNVTPLNNDDDYNIEQRLLAHCAAHLQNPLALRLIPLSAPAILNYVEHHGWKRLSSVGIFMLDIKRQAAYQGDEKSTEDKKNTNSEQCIENDILLFTEQVEIGDIVIAPIDIGEYAAISINNHGKTLNEIKPLRQLIERCKAKAYPLIFKKNDQIFANMLLVEDKGVVSIFDFAVTEHKRGQGLGQQSFKSVLAYLKNFEIKFIWLQTETSNNAASHIYKNFGFKKIYTYDYYISDIK